LLHHAACSGSLDVVEYLLEDHNGKAVIDTPDGDGWTSLHWAAKSGSKEVLAKLLSHGADPHMREPLHDHAVVQVLQHYGHNALVKEFPALVLQYGKTAEANLVSTESEEDCREWEGVTCDGCLCLVSLHRYPCGTYLNHFFYSLLEEQIIAVETVLEMGKGFTCVKNARSQVPRLILDMILLMKTRLKLWPSGGGGEEWNGVSGLLGIGIPGR